MTAGALRHKAAFAAKWVIARALSVPSVAAAWRARTLGAKALVLTYHRLLPAGTETWSHPGIIVTPETFERHMRLLQREFHLLSLDEFEHHLASRTPFPPGACLVTFDDGWFDTYTEAWPILQRLAIPAVIFLPTRYIGSSDTFWQEELGRLLCEAAASIREDATRRAPLAAALGRCQLAHLEPLVVTGDHDTMVSAVRGLKLDAAVVPAEAIAQLRGLLGPRAERPHADRFMTWDQVREMARGRVVFGAHTHTHRILSRLSTADAAEDIATSRAIIERETGVPVRAMSYPNGGWNQSVADVVAAMPLVGFTMDRGAAAIGDPPSHLRRINIHEAVTADDAFFRARLLGAF